MQEPNKRFLHTKHTCDPLSPYVGIIQIRFRVKASAYSQPACASTPFYDCITCVMAIVLTTVPLYTSPQKRQGKYYPLYFYRTMISVPAPIRIHPIRDFAVNCSCRNTNANIRVITTLNLSIGTTCEASPTCSAR